MATKKSFVPKGYEVKTGNGTDFFKLADGDNKFRILTDAIVGKEGWKDNKPFRRGGEDAEIDADEVDTNDQGKPKINDYMAFYVLDHADKKVKVAEFTQASIKKEIVKYASDEEWGHPEGYDITITKSGSGLLTKYGFKASPAKALSPADKKIVDAAEESFDLEGALSVDAE